MVNPYFNFSNNRAAQDLTERLVIGAHSMYANEMYYIPRTLMNRDDIYNESTIIEYNQAILTDFYIRSFDSYEGDGQFMSKFNLQVRDQIRLSVARRTFLTDVVPSYDVVRPMEGDLIYSPMMKRLFIIQYCNDTPSFYQMGALQTWDLTCEVYEFSNERFKTGVPEIDDLDTKYSTDEDSFGILTDDGFSLLGGDSTTIVQGQYDFEEQNEDIFAENEELTKEGNTVIDWSTTNPFNEDI